MEGPRGGGAEDPRRWKAASALCLVPHERAGDAPAPSGAPGWAAPGHLTLRTCRELGQGTGVSVYGDGASGWEKSLRLGRENVLEVDGAGAAQHCECA